MAVDEPIAIVGIGCRFPGGSSSPHRLWELLVNPGDVATKVPADRFNVAAFHHPHTRHHGTTSVLESYFLDENIRSFDASFFNISPTEAAAMDPQQRLLLETVYESLDRAGLRLEELQGSQTGVFCGLMRHDYHHLLMADMETNPPYALAGTAGSILANRVSYFFDWHGPSITIDTACSSSLVAVHLACESLRKGECSLAVVGGSNLILSPDPYIWESKMQLLSSTNRCHMWDSSANGFACGEGVASVVLKRLTDALIHGDTVECVIRATGVNSDGRSAGLAMPNSNAQSALVRATYARAGLCPKQNPHDRCQFFEAHGTGTQAGDPQEAAAIQDALFGCDVDENKPNNETIYVGSIKTIIGHTAGAAGLAGLIRASLALQHGVIPPNLHFNRLSDTVAPYTAHLEVPTRAIPWPDLPNGVPRRVSVNSFGFGGTNAHAILESFPQPGRHCFTQVEQVHQYQRALLPIVFSAASPVSLVDLLEEYVRWLQNNSNVDLLDLASSLLLRRTALRYQKAFIATSPDELRIKIQHELMLNIKDARPPIISRPTCASKIYILGVFTGQGAQWPQMSLALIQNCPKALSQMQELQQSLDDLPVEYRPDFTLLDELSAPESLSRLETTAISLPLRTALQIIQVDLLRALGVTFTAVVGHSSGEIAAAYAAGILSASDAVRVAHLRGFAVKHAASRGRMIAVNLTEHQANAICSQLMWESQVTVAAYNSPSNVTLSGDPGTVDELAWLLGSLERHPHRLNTDVAYHSHHMQPCAEPYLHALKSCNVKVRPPSSVQWFSSVYKGRVVNGTDYALDSIYWCENMLRPVLFSQAISTCLDQIPNLDLIIEVGPHPALQGSIRQILDDTRPEGSGVPYIGLAHRGENSIQSMAAAIGTLWVDLGVRDLKLQRYIHLFEPFRELRFLKSLPTYPFDHRTSYWAEPRLSQARLHCPIPPHPLLGVLSGECGQDEWRWRNYLRLEELPWLSDNRVLSDIVYPPMGYITMAVEAAQVVSRSKPVQLVEIHSLIIERTISIPADGPGVETLFKIDIESADDDTFSGRFQCQMGCGVTLQKCASGGIILALGEADPTALPPKEETVSMSHPMNVDEFYSQLQIVGAKFSDSFRAISKLTRQHGGIQGVAKVPSHDQPTFHPVIMTTVLQALWGAIMSDEGRLPALPLPTQIDLVTINPSCYNSGPIFLEASITRMGGVCGNVFMFNGQGDGIAQLEGIHLAPSKPKGSDDDQALTFGTTVWGPLNPDPTIDSPEDPPYALSIQDLQARLAVLYLRDVQAQLTAQDRERLDSHRSRYVAWMDCTLSMIRDGTHPHYTRDWLQGTIGELGSETTSHETLIHVTHIVGQSLLRFLCGEDETMLTKLRNDGSDLLTRYYQDDEAMCIMSDRLGKVVSQIVFRDPQLHIIEVGAGTGSATRSVLSSIGRDYHSYTYTDVSPAFFDEASTAFHTHEDRFVYKVLDVERDVTDQGFPIHSYDVVIASNVLHATRSLRRTLMNIRKLVKPSGYLVLLEGTDPDRVTTPFIFGGFEGWWLGEEDGRLCGPLIRREEWDALLRCTGFGRCTSYTPTIQANLTGMSVIVSQPTDSPAISAMAMDLLLVGGSTETTRKTILELETILRESFVRISSCSSVDNFTPGPRVSRLAILCLADLDHRSEETRWQWQHMHLLMKAASCLLWVSREKDPHTGVSKGLLRSLALDSSSGLLQHLAVFDSIPIKAEMLATTLMNLVRIKNEGLERPEIELGWDEGILKIPRIVRDPSINRRLLASRSPRVFDVVDTREQAVVQIISREGPKKERVNVCLTDPNNATLPAVKQFSNESLVRYQVHYCTQAALTIAETCSLFLIVGQNMTTGARQLALSISHGSIISTPLSWTWDVPGFVSINDEPKLLAAVAATVVAMAIVHLAGQSTTLWVHGPQVMGPIFTDALVSITSDTQGMMNLVLTTSQCGLPDSRVLFVHPHSSMQTLSRVLPRNISSAVLFDDGPLSRRSSLVLPGRATLRSFSDFCRPSSIAEEMDMQFVANTFKNACEFVTHTGYEKGSSPHIISPRERPSVNSLEVVNWRHPTRIEAQILPASSLVSLSPTMAYLVVNMNRELRRPVSEFLAQQGARHLVLVGEWADEDSAWITQLSRDEVQVTVVHTKAKLQISRIQTYMPIGGIIYDGLKDNPQQVAENTLLLDELCRNDVGFFILVGSLLGHIGFTGNNYIIANTTGVLSGVISRRRQRGYKGSILYLGEKSTAGDIILSERDIREAFSEAILLGRPESINNGEIFAGLRKSENWESIPKLCAWRETGTVLQCEAKNQPAGHGQTQKLDAPAQLELETSVEEAMDIVLALVTEKLRRKLGLSADVPLGRETLLHELGMDSLVAVDIHSWLSRELGTKVPVVQIMGADSIGSLVDEVVKLRNGFK
ncbi:non-reducing polyketide synthase pyr2 [Aspergillus alliaceus]|uniref:non-reducing polyketide synthase pyr2 n=1 Tax=Petromyces alliaceus TaxID=209559 RepID=UPI0012A5C8A4|nr:uncharacterized protein BDW43DRAFT_313443 [Aspergillus alliaceus]KAB8231118.1 hypothetical protein BDW43DRAFT_313443 [Aspergillus alliaceus]